MGLVVRVIYRVMRMVATQKVFNHCYLIALVAVRMSMWLVGSKCC
ncbi:hypothetical protein BSY239_2865 [Hydrogenophaga sp. RAC07]|jgi:hypothetical protein|nr:hypothetical protein [Hydrogenophaga sp. RAC07]AOF86662.1 hypothetical protein BSY239_2865 [Hydrogenophaga sp. RAC07]